LSRIRLISREHFAYTLFMISRTFLTELKQPPSTPPLSMLRVTRFRDHDELSSMIQGGESEFIQRCPGAFSGRFTILGLDTATIQIGEMDLPYLGRGSPSGDRLVFVLHLKPLHGYVWKGRPLPPGFIVALPSGSEHQDLTPGGSTWAAISFHRDRLERAFTAFDPARRPAGPGESQVLVPRRDAFDVLRRQLAAVLASVRADPSLLEVADARRGIEESLLSALGTAVGTASQSSAPGYGAAARTRVTKRVEAYLSSNPSEAIYLADLCAVAGIGERALRYIFEERYGMSPVRYLKVRRLHRVRRALRRAEPERNTVSSIARRFGIWHLGRFASEYKALFDESPLETLKKICPIDRRRGAPHVPQGLRD
jgi:AraC-like DNA-binding protein